MDNEKDKNNKRIVSFEEAVRNGRAEDDGDEGYSKSVRRHRIINRLAVALLFVIVFGVMFYLLWVRRTEAYNSIGFEWEQQVLTNADQRYVNFCGGILQYGPQGANYFTAENKDTWAAGYTMKNPRADCLGEYALIYDQGGQVAIILSAKTGQVGSISTEKPVTKGTISAYGVVALIQEDKLANSIVFFDNSGKNLDIEVGTLVDKSGYPVDIAFSPDGQMIMASFVYLDSGIMKDNITFYNFDEKRNTTGAVGGFSHYGDTLFADVAFLDDDHAVALGDGCIVTYSLKNKTAPSETNVIKIDETMTNVNYGPYGISYATKRGSMSEERNVYCLDIDGGHIYDKELDFDIKSMVASENGLYLVGSTDLLYMNNKGRIYFNGSLGCEIIQFNNPGEDNELLITTNNKVVYLKLFRG